MIAAQFLNLGTGLGETVLKVGSAAADVVEVFLFVNRVHGVVGVAGRSQTATPGEPGVVCLISSQPVWVSG